MTELQKKFIELDRKKDEVKRFFEEYNEVVSALAQEQGVGSFFQDDKGVVYQVSIPDGKFVYFEKFAVDRTRREGEKAGSLSLKKAREAGFIVEGQ